MRRFVALLALLPATVLTAQIRLDPHAPAHRRAVEAFDRLLASGAKQGPQLACRVERVPPRLGFDLRIWAGYLLSIPVREFSGQPKSAVTALIRIDPVEPPGPAVYLGRRLNVPEIPAVVPRNSVISAGGGFSLGPGRYRASIVLADVRGRTCLKQWNIKAKSAREGVPLLSPGEVASSSGAWKGFPSSVGRAASRPVTILIDAYPVFRRRHLVALSWRDQMTLLNVLGSVLAHGGFDSARVVVFDLARRQVVFDEPDFEPSSFDSLADALASVNLATVDYSTLSQGPTERGFLESLARDIARSVNPGKLVFIAPQRLPSFRTGPHDDSVWEGISRVSLLALLPTPVPEGPVAEFARSGKARVFSIYSPSDLASTIRRLASDRP